MMLQGAGFLVVDIGIDVPAERFIETAKEENADIIGLSALLTTTMPMMKEIVESINHSEIKGKVKVIIGGAPITQEYADVIGADSYAPDAGTAADKAKELMVSN